MAGDNRQLFPKTIWTKKVLIPFWVVELFFVFFTFILACINLTAASSPYWDTGDADFGSFQRQYQ